jgi:glucose-1-phosphate thymidylyltransferase
VIGVLPAAGHATRLGLSTGSKELLEVGGFPVIEYSVRRLEVGGCSEIRVVTRPEKEDLREYATRRGLRVVLGNPPHVGASVAAALHGPDPDGLVALGYPDTLWEPLDGFALLRARIDDDLDVVLGLFESPDAFRSDVVVVDERGLVADILVKPPEPPSTLVWGCLVARAAALGRVGEFAEVSDALRDAIGRRRVGSHMLSEHWLDVGVPAALERARSGNFFTCRDMTE